MRTPFVGGILMQPLVFDVQAGLHTLFNHAGTKLTGCGLDDLAVEHQLHPIRPPQVQVLPDHRLEELPSAQGGVEDLGVTDFDR